LKDNRTVNSLGTIAIDMTNQRAYLLDMDGTIVDNMAYHTRAWVEVLHGHGCSIDPHQFFIATAGHHAREIVRQYLGAGLPDAECDAIGAAKEALYRTLYAPHLKPMPGLAEFIAWARSMRIALGLATGGPTVNINFILDGLGLRQSFAAIVGAADVARGKPAPDVYLKAAAGCGALPQDCIVFEDAPLGVAAARNAAMQAVVLTTTLPADSFAGYDNVIAFGSDFTLLARDLFAPGRT
jgi:beta-phosphoglucomutase